MKLLFMDVNGVLNSKRTQLVYGPELSVQNMDNIAVDMIRKLCHLVGCSICLISDWRVNYNFFELGKLLNIPIVFETPSISGKKRGHEIENFLNNNHDIKKYAILDDHDDFLGYQKIYFVKCSFEDGFSYINFLDLVELLK